MFQSINQSIGDVFFTLYQVDASHKCRFGRENVTNKYVACMACILIVFQLLTSICLYTRKSVICENIPMCCDCAR